ncbi:c-type cytochrome domain-containing protein [Bremerella sp. JC817]|uniref:c-type cytochrome domain-containing protein n=1 Tax=Bremerella sp. JC817 TaxID=3231756 RepID=UPI00345A9918
MRYTLSFLVLFGLTTVAVADDAKPAGDVEKITYDDHVRAIFREHCFTCHNQNDAKGGLNLENFGATLEGGAGGEVVIAQDVESSRLFALISGAETPKMPPGQDLIAQEKQDIIKKWIELGALENSGSKVKAKKKSGLAMSGPVTTGKPEGPAAMPEGLWKAPVMELQSTGAITAMAHSPWAPLVAIAGQKQIALYNTDTLKLLGVIPYPQGVPYILRFSRNGEVLMAGGGRGGYSGSVTLFNVRTGKPLVTVGDEYDVVLAADVSPDLSRVALGGPQRLLRIYSTDDGSLLHEVKKHTDWVTTIAYSPDGVLLASGDRSNGLFVWEADTAREYLNLQGHKEAINSVSWQPDSNVLASASTDGTVKLWEMVEGKNIKSFNAHGGGAEWVSYTHDGRMVTAGRDKVAKVWAGDGKELAKTAGFGDLTLRACFNYDSTKIVVGDWTGEIRVYQVEGMQELGKLKAVTPTYDQMIASLQSEIGTLDKAAADQGGAAAAAKQAWDNHLAAIENTKKASADAKTAMDAANAKVEELKKAIAQSEATQKQKEQEAAAKDADAKNWAGEIAKAEQSLNQINAKLADYGKKVQDKTNALNSAKGAQAEHQKQLEDLKKQLAAQQQAHEAAQKKVADLDAKIAEAVKQKETTPDDQKESKQKEIDSLTQEKMAAQGEVDKLAAEVKKSTDAVGGKDAELKKDAEAIAAADAEVKKLQAEAGKANEEKAAAEKSIASAKQNKQTADTQLASAKGEIEAAKKAKDDASKEMGSQQNLAKRYGDEINKHAEQLKKLEEGKPNVEKDMNDKAAAAKAAAERAAAAKQDLEALKKEKADFAAFPAKLQAEQAAMLTGIQTKEQAMAEAAAQMAELEKQMEAKLAEIAKLQAQLDKTMEEKSAVYAKLRDSKQKVEAGSEEMATAQAKLQDLKRQQEMLQNVYQ